MNVVSFVRCRIATFAIPLFAAVLFSSVGLVPLMAAENENLDEAEAEAKQLGEQLHDSSNPAKQIEAAGALGRLKHAEAEAEVTLTYAVTFLSGQVRVAAKEALRQREGVKTATSDRAAKLRTSEDVKQLVVDLGSSYPSVRVWACRELTKLGPRAAGAVPFLLDALEDDAYECPDDLADKVSFAARQALKGIGQPAVEPALARLKHPRPAARACAAGILRYLGDRRAIGPLLAALGDDDRVVRDKAIVALASFKDPATIQPILALLDKEEYGEHTDAVATAMTIFGPAGVGPLADMLSHKDRRVRETAASRLAYIDHPRAVDPLLKALQDDYHHVQGYAAQSLYWIRKRRGPQPIIDVLAMKDAYHEVRRVALHALQGHPREVEFLSEALSDQSRDVQSHAAWRLEQLRPPAALDAMIAALAESKYSDVRGDVAEVLGRLKDPRAVEPLIAALDEPNSLARGQMATALGRIGDARAIGPLLAARHREGWSARVGVACALGEFDDPRVVAPLLEMLAARESTVRCGAARTLANVKADGVVDALIERLKQDEDNYVRQHVAEALGKQGDRRAIEALTDALDDKQGNVRGAAAKALQNLKRP